jgi:hypothetical protein
MSADEQKKRCGLIVDRVRMPSDPRARIWSLDHGAEKTRTRKAVVRVTLAWQKLKILKSDACPPVGDRESQEEPQTSKAEVCYAGSPKVRLGLTR